MVNMVARLEAFAGMSRMKRLALVVLCHTVTDAHLTRLKVSLLFTNFAAGNFIMSFDCSMCESLRLL